MMAAKKLPSTEKLERLVQRMSFFVIVGDNQLFCKICDRVVSYQLEKPSQIKWTHLKSKGHLERRSQLEQINIRYPRDLQASRESTGQDIFQDDLRDTPRRINRTDNWRLGPKLPIKEKLNRLAERNPCFVVVGDDQLYCKICDEFVTFDPKKVCQVKWHHLSTIRHRERLSRLDQRNINRTTTNPKPTKTPRNSTATKATQCSLELTSAHMFQTGQPTMALPDVNGQHIIQYQTNQVQCQTMSQISPSTKEEFASDIANTLAAVDIPSYVLETQAFRNFIAKWTGFFITSTPVHSLQR